MIKFRLLRLLHLLNIPEQVCMRVQVLTEFCGNRRKFMRQYCIEGIISSSTYFWFSSWGPINETGQKQINKTKQTGVYEYVTCGVHKGAVSCE